MSLGYTNLHYIVENEIKRMSAVMPEPVKIQFILPTIDEVIEKVAEFTRISKEDVVGRSRVPHVMFARHLSNAICVALVSRYRAPWSLTNIGDKFGGKDHTTVLNSSRVISDMIDVKYRIYEIKEVAEYFHLDLDNLRHKPNPTCTYYDIKIYDGDILIGTYSNTKAAAKAFNVGQSNIISAISIGYKLKRKYTVESKYKRLN